MLPPLPLAGIDDLALAYASGVNVRDIANQVLNRIEAIDRSGPALGAIPVLNPRLADDAHALDCLAPSDRGQLHGIPVTVKDSFSVAGLTMAAGSPAFARTIACRDAVVVERLRAAGAALVGKTNMPPMAIGGGQAGLYGRTRSPYNPDWLAAAWHSGSSIGSAVATAAGLDAVGIGEETVSSGRSPASNNALVAYTPSWGVISSEGNWPLHPLRDVVVPHTRSVADLAAVLPTIVGGSEHDIMRQQHAVPLRAADAVIDALRHPLDAEQLRGLRFGVPRIYLGEGDDSIPLRPSIRERWDETAARLQDAGVELVATDIPVVEHYEHRNGAATLEALGYLSDDWTQYELSTAMTFVWQRHLDGFAEGSPRLRDINPYVIRPDAPWTMDAIESGAIHPGRDRFDYASIVSEDPPDERSFFEHVDMALGGLDAARRDLHDRWMSDCDFDAIIFPANSDIGAWNADVDSAAARAAWADGCVFSSGNHVWRRVGIPTVTLPMGLMRDISMPVGVTLAGAGWSDAHLLRIAMAVAAILPDRPIPPVSAADFDAQKHMHAANSSEHSAGANKNRT